MIRQPADAEEHGDDDDHLGDLPLGPLRFRHAIQRVYSCPQKFDGPGVGKADYQNRDHIAKHKCACVQHFAVVFLPSGDAHVAIGKIDEVVVAQVGSGKHQGEPPDHHHGNHCVARRPKFPGPQWIANS